MTDSEFLTDFWLDSMIRTDIIGPRFYTNMAWNRPRAPPHHRKMQWSPETDRGYSDPQKWSHPRKKFTFRHHAVNTTSVLLLRITSVLQAPRKRTLDLLPHAQFHNHASTFCTQKLNHSSHFTIGWCWTLHFYANFHKARKTLSNWVWQKILRHKLRKTL